MGSGVGPPKLHPDLSMIRTPITMFSNRLFSTSKLSAVSTLMPFVKFTNMQFLIVTSSGKRRAGGELGAQRGAAERSRNVTAR